MPGKYVFNLLGSDPELVFGKTNNKPLKSYMVSPGSQMPIEPMPTPTHVVVNAMKLMGVPTKEMGLASFIGFDAHPATAELRPPPSHNVYRHLAHIGFALQRIQAVLAKSKKYPDVTAIARPVFAAEALGGHAHASLLFDEPDTKIAMDFNQIYHVGQLRPYHSQVAVDLTTISPAQQEAIARYTRAASMGQATTPEVVCRTLDYFGLPFEYWIQPYANRQERMYWCKHSHHYNGELPGHGDNANYLVRWVCSKRPERPLFNDYAYLHTEWRTPSSWLMHPALAYVYLALVKLVMLNFENARALAVSGKPLKDTGLADPDTYRKLFLDRLQELEADGPVRVTKDVKDIVKAAEFCGEMRLSWFEDIMHGIDVKAWQNVAQGENA